MKLDLVADPVGALGGLTGRGAKRVLGSPEQGLLETVVREAVQNSWDARRESQVQFGIAAYSLSRAQRSAIEEMLAEGIDQRPAVLTLPRGREDFDAIAIFDRGTKGLGGRPIADAADDENGDFARFVFSIGDTKPQHGSVATGGTYGFGRSAFLNASALGTILVHTAFQTATGTRETRFLGMNWGERYEKGRSGRKFTGRHWWGTRLRDGVAPITGKKADHLAAVAGMPAIDPDELGTTILILQPRWSMSEGEDEADENIDGREQGLHRVHDELLWYSWPRLLDRSIGVSLEWFGRSVPVEDPAAHPRLKLFARALEVATGKRRARSTEHQEGVECQRPRKLLGSIGLAQRAQQGIEDRHMPGPLHHVALMRETRLVVRYQPCAQAAEGSEYAGVFVTDAEVDDVFAASEPPTHDRWVKESLADRTSRVFVNVALNKIGAIAREFATPSSQGCDGVGTGLGPICDELGSLLPEATGGAVGPRRKNHDSSGREDSGTGTGAGPGSGAAQSHVTIRLGTPAHRNDEGRRMLEIPFTMRAGEKSVSVEAKVRVVVDGGGTEEEMPEGATAPEVLGWRLHSPERHVSGPQLKLPATRELTGLLVIDQPSDCSVRIAISPVR